MTLTVSQQDRVRVFETRMAAAGWERNTDGPAPAAYRWSTQSSPSAEAAYVFHSRDKEQLRLTLTLADQRVTLSINAEWGFDWSFDRLVDLLAGAPVMTAAGAGRAWLDRLRTRPRCMSPEPMAAGSPSDAGRVIRMSPGPTRRLGPFWRR